MSECDRERCHSPATMRIRSKAGHWGPLNMRGGEQEKYAFPGKWLYWCTRHGFSYVGRVSNKSIEIEVQR
jgi:hypothetical protein